MHERRYNRAVERLRDPERVARMEVERVVSLALEGLEGIGTVLDIGTGSGLFAEQFAGRGLDVAGVDANPEMLRAAQGFVPGGSFREAPAEKLPYLAESFDLAFMGLVLHETDDALLALREACRVTARRVAVLEWPAEEQPFGPPMEERLTAERLQELALAAGFRSVTPIRLTALTLYLLDK